MRPTRHPHTPPIAAIAVALAAALSLSTAPATGQPLALGFTDPVFEAPEPTAGEWLERASASGAVFVRLSANWAGIARSRPAEPANPADPAYDWQGLDEVLRTVAAHGLEPAVTVSGAPGWAETPGRPHSVDPGTWRPDPVAYGQFAQALALRYSGAYPDPLHPGTALPRVRYWQAWNEPNLAIDLSPQWVISGHGYLPASPSIYRALLNAFYRGVKAGSPHALVVSAGTAPFGDLRPDENDQANQRMPPVDFVRELLCLHGSRLVPEHCPDPAHFDILDHHPYAVGGPFAPALDPGDVSIPDLAKLTVPLRKAERTGRALPRGHKALWVTEVSYDSNPPDPHGVPMRTHARWVQQTLYELWREGASLVSWFLIRDQPPIPNYGATYQSGMYFYDGTPKLSQRAFSFPFVIEPAGHGRTVWWTRAPLAGRLLLQRHSPRGWHTVYSIAVGAHQAIERTLPSRWRGGTWRAVVGGEASLTWPV
jgi:hypothetical protein